MRGHDVHSVSVDEASSEQEEPVSVSASDKLSEGHVDEAAEQVDGECAES